MRLNTLNVQNVGTNGRSKYLDILDAAWQEHLRPRELSALTIISLFAGAGGSSLGYSMAGYKELLAVEWDNNAVETFKLNFPDIQIWHGDIIKLSVDECLQVTGLEPGELDVLDGSPPCQGFSTAGKRQLNDPRNSLAVEFIRLLRGLKPKVFVMENVSGLVKGKMKLVFAEIMREMKASGYQVKCQLMNTMYFNVPQSRQRLIWIGTRNDLEIEPSYPKAVNRPYTTRDAIENYKDREKNNRKLITKGLMPIADKLRPGENGSKYSRKGSYFGLIRLHPSKPAPTIIKSAGTGIIHYSENRYFCSEKELQLLQSFPEQFKFIGNRNLIIVAIGNSVPPFFMKAIAEHIRNEILVQVNMTLGEPELIT